MSRKSASDEVAGVIIPRFQPVAIPERVTKPFPELAKWHAEETDGREQWRLRASVTLNRAITDSSKSLQDQINGMQSTSLASMQAAITQLQADVVTLQATVISLQNQITFYHP